MSDIFISAGLSTNAAEAARRLAWTPRTQVWSGSSSRFTWAASRVDSADLWAPAHDPETGLLALIAGRLSFEAPEWAAARALPYSGGLAARRLIAAFRAGGTAAIERMNGAALIAIIDPADGVLHVWTDRMAFYPGFIGRGAGVAICSHSDIAAWALESAGTPCTIDETSIAEFLHTGLASPPHTYWREVKRLDAATRLSLSAAAPAQIAQAQYWRPAGIDGAAPLPDDEVIERLTGALRAATRRRTQPLLGEPALLLSSGADSRAALFGAEDPARFTCYTMYDEPNAELAGAQALAAAAGAQHIALKRAPNYYFDCAHEAIRLSGGMWSIESAHFLGATKAVHDIGAGVLLTGCYADYLFKGLGFNRRPLRFAGRNLPLYELADFTLDWYLPHVPIAPAWAPKTRARLEERFSGVVDAAQIENLRLSPISGEGDVVSRVMLWRTAPFDLLTGDSDLVELHGLMTPQQKLNGLLFGRAVATVTGPRANGVANNNFGAPVGASAAGRVAAFALASLRRKIVGGGKQPFERDPSSVATVHSWPYIPRVVERSPEIAAWSADLAAGGDPLIAAIVGPERSGWNARQWASEATLCLRAYTASTWLRRNAEWRAP